MKFAKDLLTTFSTTITVFLLTIVSSIIIARTLGPEGQGIYTLVLLLPSLILIITNFGISRSAIYHLSKGDLPKDLLIGNYFISVFVLILASIIFGVILIQVFGSELFPNVPYDLLFLGLLILPLQLLFIQFFSGILFGLQKIKIYNLFNLIQTILLLLTVFILILILKWNIQGAIYASIISLIITDLLIAIWILKNVPISIKFNKHMQKSLFSFGIKVHASNIMYFFRSRVDVFIINLFLNPQAVGLYGIAYGTAETIGMLSQSAGNVLSPKISSMSSEEQKKFFTPIVVRNVLFISFLGALILFLIGYWLIRFLYSDAYSNSVLPMNILLIGIIAISAERILTSDIIARGKPMISTYITLAVVILNIILNIILIPIIGIIGAAWASSITYSINLILTLAIYCKISGNNPKKILIIKKSDLYLYRSLYKSIKSNFLNR